MKRGFRYRLCAIMFCLAMPGISGYASAQGEYKAGQKNYRFDATSAKLNAASAEIIEDDRLESKKGITLKQGIAAALDGERTEPDLVFNVQVQEAGRYVMSTNAFTDAEGEVLMKKAKTKFESLYIKIQIDDSRPTKRVVYVPWDVRKQHSGKFAFTGEAQQLKIWLPRGVRLDYIELTPYNPPKVPDAAQHYKPRVTPPASRPRLWVNRETLPVVKANLETGDHREAWEKVGKLAAKPFEFRLTPGQEVSFNAALEKAAEAKAFFYLMTGNREIGREAVTLMKDYLSLVEFGNLLDITREIGRAIYTGSEVYDWCYDLLSAEEKQLLYKHLMRLADDMEIGWPPFLTSIVNGHGNEAQVNRDLLSMSIAVYDEDPLPYQYCAYHVLEQLAPLRKFEYQSPRHNQGVNYGAYRFGWEMHAAWLFYRMTGTPAFDDNIKGVRQYWLYMRMPDGQMLRDGDGFTTGATGQFFYWKSPLTMLLCYAYANDPVLKGDFVRQGGVPGDPIPYLLLDDPALKAEPGRDSLPLTKDFGPVLGSMVARTGWNIGMNSNDVVAEIKGGGYHFGNHQHSDAGSLQLYYRGLQFGDLGVYKFYGTPYDMGFNKRSIAHSMMLAVDPAEIIPRNAANDGGTRLNQRYPKTVEEVTSDPWFKNGEVVSSSFGPSQMKPAFSYFSADLASAYTQKVEKYNRSFCFLNLGREDIPAAVILTDHMQTASPGFRKYWQINALNKPELTDKGFVLHNRRENLTGKTHVEMLLPKPADRTLEVASGEEVTNVFGTRLEVPPSVDLPEVNGHRVVISPAGAAARDRFLTVMQMTADETRPLPVTWYETPVSYVVSIADRVVSLSNSESLISAGFRIKIEGSGKKQVVLTALQAGKWRVSGGSPRVDIKTVVEGGKNTLYFEAGKGSYAVTPVE